MNRPLGNKPRRPSMIKLDPQDTFQPPSPGEAIDKYRKRRSKTCCSCEWFNPQDPKYYPGLGHCRRNPVYIERRDADWCGEFVAR